MSRLPLTVPQLLGLVVLLVFLPWVFLTGKSERDARAAIQRYDPFAIPDFPIKFSKTLKYDPLGILGRGVQAGFWEWTPAGMVLAEKGRPYFADTPEAIASLVGCGRRVVTAIERYQDRDGKREVRFLYRWVEVTPPAHALLSTPPETDREYDGRAILVKQDGQWQVEWMETPFFDKPMALLKDESQEIKR